MQESKNYFIVFPQPDCVWEKCANLEEDKRVEEKLTKHMERNRQRLIELGIGESVLGKTWFGLCNIEINLHDAEVRYLHQLIKQNRLNIYIARKAHAFNQQYLQNFLSHKKGDLFKQTAKE